MAISAPTRSNCVDWETDSLKASFHICRMGMLTSPLKFAAKIRKMPMKLLREYLVQSWPSITGNCYDPYCGKGFTHSCLL